MKGDTPRLIDEWQLAPKLWDAIRFEVDHRDELGQFVLTGSAVPANTKEITHSGTGRFTWLTLRTMSLYESGDSTGEVSLKELFDGKETIDGESNITIDRLAFLCAGAGGRRLMLSYARNQGGQVYHYRDKNGLECDAVIHLRNGRYGLIEIKLGGDKLIEEGANTLKVMEAKIDTDKIKAPSFLMILTGTGDYPYRRKDGVYVVPVGCLKD